MVLPIFFVVDLGQEFVFIIEVCCCFCARRGQAETIAMLFGGRGGLFVLHDLFDGPSECCRGCGWFVGGPEGVGVEFVEEGEEIDFL